MIGLRFSSSSSRLSIRLLSRSLAWSTISAVVLPNAASALYPNVITRASGVSFGRKSFGQKDFVSGSVQDSIASPLRPWTKTMLRNERVSCHGQYETADGARHGHTYSTVGVEAAPSPTPSGEYRTVRTMVSTGRRSSRTRMHQQVMKSYRTSNYGDRICRQKTWAWGGRGQSCRQWNGCNWVLPGPVEYTMSTNTSRSEFQALVPCLPSKFNSAVRRGRSQPPALASRAKRTDQWSADYSVLLPRRLRARSRSGVFYPTSPAKRMS